MHGPGVVGEEQGGDFELGDELRKGGLAAEVLNLAGESLSQCLAEGCLLGGADDDPGEVEILGDLLHGGAVVLQGPALGGAVFRTGAEGDPERAPGIGARGSGRQFGCPEAPDHRKQFVGLMKDRVELPDGGHRLVEEAASAVDVASDPAGDAGEPDLQGATHGVRQEDGGVVFA